MRTDTATFRSNTFKAIRAQGVNSAKSRRIVEMLAYQFRMNGFPVLADTTRILVSMRGVNQQTVDVVNEGLVTLQLDAWTLDALQPLIPTTPTLRQLEIATELSEMMTDVYSAIGDACEAYDAQFGYPADTAGAEVRYQWSRTFPAVVAITAAYDALKAESLAINPHVECHLVDPDKASHWYEWVKDTRGYRPTGFMTLAMVEADMKMLETERPYDEMDEAA